MLTTDSSVAVESHLVTTLRLTHIPSGQYKLIKLDWPRHAAANFVEAPLACKATMTHAWRTVALDLLQIPVKRAPVVVEKKAPTLEKTPSKASNERHGVAQDSSKSWIDQPWMTREDACAALPRLVERYREATGVEVDQVGVWNQSFPDEKVTDHLLGPERVQRLVLHLSQYLDERDRLCH
jgi:hypothetical protein